MFDSGMHAITDCFSLEFQSPQITRVVIVDWTTLGGTGETAGFDDTEECFQLVDLHRSFSRSICFIDGTYPLHSLYR